MEYIRYWEAVEDINKRFRELAGQDAIVELNYPYKPPEKPYKRTLPIKE